MKIKLSKTLAIALALCLTFAGFSAFAADVEIVTSYDYSTCLNEEGKATDASVSVTAKVNNIAEGSEVTYYVRAGDEIVYINQETANADGVAAFKTFTAAWNKLTASKVVFGSDANWSEGDFTFVPAGNYKTSGTANAVADAVWAQPFNELDAEGNPVVGFQYTAKVKGNYSEYGIRATIDGVEVELPALGCSEDGDYTVVVFGDGITSAPDAVAYAK